MRLLLSANIRGWVSFPIIMLLLAVSVLSMHYQETLQATYRWRGQLNDVEQSQQVWLDFRTDFMTSTPYHSASLSQCVGFCDLLEQQESGEENTWSKGGQTLQYQWSRYEWYAQDEVSESETSTELSDVETSYRLCATQNQQTYLCWWWRNDKLLSNGWLSVN